MTPKHSIPEGNYIGKVINNHLHYGEVETNIGKIETYVVVRKDAFDLCDKLILDFMRFYGCEAPLPTREEGRKDLLEQFKRYNP